MHKSLVIRYNNPLKSIYIKTILNAFSAAALWLSEDIIALNMRLLPIRGLRGVRWELPKSVVFITGLFTLLTFSCEKQDIEMDSNVPVVEAYLIQGQPINHVKLTTIIPYLTEEDSTQDPLDGISVIITEGLNEYTLHPIPDSSGYYYFPDTTVIIQENRTYSLQFEYNEKITSSTTTVPSKPQDMAISDNTFYTERIEEGGGMPGDDEQEMIEITWDNTDGDYYFLKITCIEEVYDFIEERMEEMVESEDYDISIEDLISTTSEPSMLDMHEMNSHMLRFFGTHQVVLYKVNQEYADLFENTSTNSQKLTEPISNITNGKGIFTAVNSDTLYFEVLEAK